MSLLSNDLRVDLHGKVAVVTGAGRGIGRTLALGYAEAGADMVLAARTASELEELAAECRALGVRAHVVAADLRQVANCHRVMDEAVAAFGQLDIVMNNAGMNIPKDTLDVTEEEFDRLMDLNLKGVFFCCQAAGRHMLPRGYGRIINMASTMSVVALPRRALYCAAKGGVAQLTKALALEWATRGVTVNAIGPTFVETPMTRPFFADEAFRADVLRRIPLGELEQTEDLVSSALFLASDAARFVTGHLLLADGGWTAQ